MLISPPFLPDRAAGTSEEQWLDAAMAIDGRDRYPVQLHDHQAPMTWHTGQHLVAPEVAGGRLPVCAIADGTVVCVKPPTARNQDAKHPLNYGDGDNPNNPVWSSDGCVVIKHSTEIGANQQGTPTKVEFYSVYMHLHQIEPTVREKQPIYRKDKLGAAGYIYGQPHRLHLEIVCNEDQMAAILGRAPAILSLANNPPSGRTDAVFGEMYYWQAGETVAYNANPLEHAYQQRQQPNTPRPAPAEVERVSGLLIGIRYEQGNAILSTYTPNGTLLGQRSDAQFEYKLYEHATTLATQLSALKTSPTSSPSALYELLRFGRVLGPDPLTPATTEHWRKVRLPSGAEAWVNLNAAGVRIFSEADMPAFKGWSIVQDWQDGNSRVDASALKTWADENGDGQVSVEEARTRFSHASLQRRLSKLICKVPFEWNADNLDARWGWLADPQQYRDAMSTEDFGRFKDHAKALCFWKASSGIAETPWSFEPRAFIEHFRKCGWLSAKEFAQCFPRKLLHLHGTAFRETSVEWETAIARATIWSNVFNKTNRKYGIDIPRTRLIHYFSHVIPETGFLSLVKEGDNKTGTYLKNQKYWPYYGRGLIQLTWLDTYKKYGNFRNIPKTTTPGIYASLGWNPDDVIASNNSQYNAFNCADSAGFYLASHKTIKKEMDEGLEQENAIQVSKCVNGNFDIEFLNGLEIRLQSVLFLKTALLDNSSSEAKEKMTFSWRRNSSKEPAIDAHGKKVEKFILKVPPWSIDVPLDKQRPK